MTFKTLFLMTMFLTPSLFAAEMVGEAVLEKDQWMMTTHDASSGAKVIYQLVGFNKTSAKNHFKGEFIYARVKGRDIACKGGGRCFEVSDFEAVPYDPLKHRLNRK